MSKKLVLGTLVIGFEYAAIASITIHYDCHDYDGPQHRNQVHLLHAEPVLSLGD